MPTSTQHPRDVVHRMSELVEPIATVSFAGSVTTAFREAGLRGYWDGYFAGRAAPLGPAPASVVDAVFYNFAPGEVARHVPWVWERITPDEALAVRERASAEALRRRLGDLADAPALTRAADLATRAAYSAPSAGRPLYAGLAALSAPEEPVARLWHAATLLREHRGDSHNSVLVTHGIGGGEGHVLLALSWGERPKEFSRLQHLPADDVEALIDGLRRRGILDASGGFTPTGREIRERIEATTDDLAARAYDVLTRDEMGALVADLESLTTAW